ncbi:MAG: helix-turn-helix transcriptional regulator [Pseudomonadota bacterium]
MQKNCPVCGGTGLIQIPVGERVKAMRTERGETQKTLASALGISRTALTNIEAGRQDVSTDKLVVLARYFECTTDHLLGLT